MSGRAFLNGRIRLFSGDMLSVLPALPENSVDSVVCDPPYHLTSIVNRFGAEGTAPAKAGATGAFARASAGFMGKQWDGGDIAFRPETWAAVLRVLKPGAYIVAFSSSRTFGRMSVAMEDAGFITHPMIGWLFGQGFPKATRIKAEGYDGFRYGAQALKPALEPIYMGQKPFSEATGTANILRHGTGALNIDGCRVATDDTINQPSTKGTLCGTDGTGWDRPWKSDDAAVAARDARAREAIAKAETVGRWPANLIHDGSDEVLAGFPETGLSSGGMGQRLGGEGVYGSYEPMLRANAGGLGDAGSAARFFYAAKADSDDRIGSRHPTVKPLDLMQYLVRLVTAPGGLVLDPFAGTGTTGEAAIREGMRAILIEMEAESQADIGRRMDLLSAGPAERKRVIAQAKARAQAEPGPLFDPAPAAPHPQAAE